MPERGIRTDPTRENQPLDISVEVTAAFASKNRFRDLRTLMISDRVRNARSLTLTLDYSDIDDANWVKAFLQEGDEQERTATIRATTAQHDEAANAFGSGISWIEVQH